MSDDRTTYEIILYRPDVLSGTQWAIGALVHAGGETTFVESPTLPGRKLLGGAGHRLMESMIDTMREGEVYPANIGPHLMMCARDPVPSEVAEPVKWVRESVLPGYGGGE